MNERIREYRTRRVAANPPLKENTRRSIIILAVGIGDVRSVSSRARTKRKERISIRRRRKTTMGKKKKKKSEVQPRGGQGLARTRILVVRCRGKRRREERAGGEEETGEKDEETREHQMPRKWRRNEHAAATA